MVRVAGIVGGLPGLPTPIDDSSTERLLDYRALAKDLSAAEESTIGGGPFRATRSDDLTSAGSVLGTPAYMAPEQERGEPVDQRADVFAIGTMLWELCALGRVPPADAAQRRCLFRRAGIDKDLAAIIDKALDSDPERRYADAGALAADLKAFKSGARIAARSYSLFAMLAHWTLRHRTLALSTATVIAIAIAGSILYIRNITTERDRADIALERVETTKNDLALEHAELTLKHAELLLTTDPSAAIDSLATYHGVNLDHANQLRAAATGLGTALLRATPHTDNIRLAVGKTDGTISHLKWHGVMKDFPRIDLTLLQTRKFTLHKETIILLTLRQLKEAAGGASADENCDTSISTTTTQVWS